MPTARVKPLLGHNARHKIEYARSILHGVTARAPMPKGKILHSIKYRRAMRDIETACNSVADLWPEPKIAMGPVALRRARG